MAKPKGFIKDCILLQSKEPLHVVIGLWVWVNVLHIAAVIYRIASGC